MQTTIKKSVKASGVGVHYNKICNIKLKPAKSCTGIMFKRVDITDKNNEIQANFTNIQSTALSTKLINSDGVFVSTVEHLLSALFAFGITNLIIEVDSPEMPIMEGGAEDFCFLLECAGKFIQKETATKLKLLKEIKVGDENSYIIASPFSEFKVEFTSNFPSKEIGEQHFIYTKTLDFTKEIAPARTIANLKEVNTLQKAGFGLGGSLTNTLVFDEEKILNEPCLYNKNDFVKHKVLDFIGDISLAGGEILANFKCYKSGHKLNHQIVEAIFSDSSNYQLL